MPSSPIPFPDKRRLYFDDMDRVGKARCKQTPGKGTEPESLYRFPLALFGGLCIFIGCDKAIIDSQGLSCFVLDWDVVSLFE